MLKQRTARPKKKESRRDSIVTIGVLVALDQAGVPHVDYPGNRQAARPARTTVALTSAQVGQQVALVFADGEPLILGVVRQPGPQPRQLQVAVDGETITLAADKELVLKCGKATIILAEDGKVTIRGTYLLSRSSGVNRILGGSVQLN